MDERDQRNIAAVRRFYQGEEAERRDAAPNIVWHVPGHNPVSGIYKGAGEYFDLMPSRMAPLDEWSFDLRDVMVNGDYVMTTLRVKG